MRTITLYTPDGDLAADQIAKLLLDLPRGGDHNYLHFDRRGPRHTVAWRYVDGTWAVTFRDPPTSADQRRQYDNPVTAARAIIARRHQDQRQPVQGRRSQAEWAELADRYYAPANDPTVCEPAGEVN